MKYDGNRRSEGTAPLLDWREIEENAELVEINIDFSLGMLILSWQWDTTEI